MRALIASAGDPIDTCLPFTATEPDFNLGKTEQCKEEFSLAHPIKATQANNSPRPQVKRNAVDGRESQVANCKRCLLFRGYVLNEGASGDRQPRSSGQS